MSYAFNLSNKQAAEHINISISTLNNSRYTGTLAGVTAPPYKKLGKKVLYSEQALNEWLSQFEEQTSTSQNSAA